MPNLTIGTLEGNLANQLQRAAAQHGRTIDEEAAAILRESLERDVAESSGNSTVGIEHIELAVDEHNANGKGLREHTRVDYRDIRARFSSGAATKRFFFFTRQFPCEVIDISIRGACIESNQDLHVGNTITLYFSSADSGKVVITGSVTRSSRGLNGGFQYGVQFAAVVPQGDLRTIICRKVVETKFR